MRTPEQPTDLDAAPGCGDQQLTYRRPVLGQSLVGVPSPVGEEDPVPRRVRRTTSSSRAKYSTPCTCGITRFPPVQGASAPGKNQSLTVTG